MSSRSSGLPRRLPWNLPVRTHDDRGQPDHLTFDAIARTTHFIAIDGRDGEAGLCMLNWHPELRVISPAVTDAAFKFTVLGHAGDRYLVETSYDLATWKPSVGITND